MALQTLPDQTLTALPVALSTTSKKALWVQVQANVNNGACRIGDRNITSSRGGIIQGGGSYQFSPTAGNANAYDLSDIYVLGTPGDTVAILYDTN